jgi:hypothetical protein
VDHRPRIPVWAQRLIAGLALMCAGVAVAAVSHGVLQGVGVVVFLVGSVIAPLRLRSRS